jgi:hypothetical protein
MSAVRVGPGREVAGDAEPVLPVRAAAGGEGRDVGLERRRDRRVGHGRVVGDRQRGHARELRDRHAGAGVAQRARERPEGGLDLVGGAGVGDRSGPVEDDVDVDAAGRDQVRVGRRLRALVGRRLDRPLRRERRDDGGHGHRRPEQDGPPCSCRCRHLVWTPDSSHSARPMRRGQ